MLFMDFIQECEDSPEKLKDAKDNIYSGSACYLFSKVKYAECPVPFTKQNPLASLFFAWCNPPAQFTAMSHLSLLRRAAPSTDRDRERKTALDLRKGIDG